MVNADAAANGTGNYSASSSGEEGEVDSRDLDRLVKLKRAAVKKSHARCQVVLPAGMQANVMYIYDFCSNKNPLWEHIGHTEVAPLPHSSTNRFKITDDLAKATIVQTGRRRRLSARRGS